MQVYRVWIDGRGSSEDRGAETVILNAAERSEGSLCSERSFAPLRMTTPFLGENLVDWRVQAIGGKRHVFETALERIVIADRRPVDPQRRIDRRGDILGL